jgi:hypothetical protein
VPPKTPSSKTIQFEIPSNATVHRRGNTTAHRILWIHQAHNAKHCHNVNDVPGDLPYFYVEVQNWDGPSEIIDDFQTNDDLEAWLEDHKSDRCAF